MIALLTKETLCKSLNLNNLPLGMNRLICFYACHSKVKRFCKQLTILPGYLEKNGVNQAVLNDVKTILQYFNHAAPLHHDDEEKTFSPL